ncbi:hypothetical protein EDC04DRAFT_3102774 [Pisolithus marmoratus]|nr:hypothetical protein EDC04DRAFT_3102774 [Pisolithus marmoratus]
MAAFWTLLDKLSSDILRVPHTSATLPFDIYTFFVYVLPACLSFYIVAVLVILPGTRALRIALWPFVVLLAYRAAIFVDFSRKNPQQTYLNVNFALAMLCMVMRTLEWALSKGPLRRRIGPAPSALVDALDLMMNVRGVGWNWSKGLRFPPDTRPTSRLWFAIYVLFSALYHSFIRGVFHIAIQAFEPEAFTIVNGGTIFDNTLPPLIRYTRSSIISAFTAFFIYADVQNTYDICAFMGVTILQQNPAQWPPVFDEPWKSTSLHDFWGYRWHQLLRRTFVVLGGWPLMFVFGRVGYVLGTFLASGVLHNVVVAMLNGCVEWWWMLLSFGMMAIGVIIEHAFAQMTGRRVGGWIGRVWMVVWLLIWGNMMVDGHARAGFFASSNTFVTATPAKGIVEHYVTALDRWLRECAS